MVLSMESPFDRSRVLVFTSPSADYTPIQAVQYAAANDWAVFYSLNGAFCLELSENAWFLDLLTVTDTMNSSTSYVCDPRTRTYPRLAYAFQTLQDFLAVNLQLLRKLNTPEYIPIEGWATIPKGAFPTALIAVGTKDKDSVSAILSALL
jgi:hypothetical protein